MHQTFLAGVIMGNKWIEVSALVRIWVLSWVLVMASWAQPHWKSVRWNGVNVAAVKAFGKESGVAVGYVMGVLKTGDGGATWNNVADPTALQISSAWFIDS